MMRYDDRMKLSLEEISERLDASPFNRMLGLTVVETEPDLRLRMTASPELEGRPSSGIVHGGILSTLIDVGGSFAIISRIGLTVATIDLLVDYHRAAPLGELEILSEVIRIGGSICTTRSTVMDRDGKIFATGRCAFMILGVNDHSREARRR